MAQIVKISRVALIPAINALLRPQSCAITLYPDSYNTTQHTG